MSAGTEIMGKKRFTLVNLAQIAVLAFAWGAVSLALGLFPVPQIQKSFAQVSDFARHWKNDLGIEPTRYLVPARPADAARPALDSARAMPGLRLVAGYYREYDGHGAMLMDIDGNELFFWPVDGKQLGAREHPYSFLHGLEALEDGSIIVNFDEGNVLARIDACGAVVWKNHGRFHHAVNRTADGMLWAPGGDVDENWISRIDPQSGAIVWSASLEALFSGPARGIVGIMRETVEGRTGWFHDPFHFNDLDVLSAETAPAFPMFEAGDLLVSLRNLNLVAVLDARFEHFKWWQHGPWHRQHDVDFLPDGRISLFNNNMHAGVSQVVAIDPATGKIDVVYEGTDEAPFYSWIRGKQAFLDNGDFLITEPMAGRAFEIDLDGTVVWEFVNTYDAERNLLVSNAMWLPKDFFRDGMPRCSETAAAPASP